MEETPVTKSTTTAITTSSSESSESSSESSPHSITASTTATNASTTDITTASRTTRQQYYKVDIYKEANRCIGESRYHVMNMAFDNTAVAPTTESTFERYVQMLCNIPQKPSEFSIPKTVADDGSHILISIILYKPSKDTFTSSLKSTLSRLFFLLVKHDRAATATPVLTSKDFCWIMTHCILKNEHAAYLIPRIFDLPEISHVMLTCAVTTQLSPLPLAIILHQNDFIDIMSKTQFHCATTCIKSAIFCSVLHGNIVSLDYILRSFSNLIGDELDSWSFVYDQTNSKILLQSEIVYDMIPGNPNYSGALVKYHRDRVVGTIFKHDKQSMSVTEFINALMNIQSPAEVRRLRHINDLILRYKKWYCLFQKGYASETLLVYMTADVFEIVASYLEPVDKSIDAPAKS